MINLYPYNMWILAAAFAALIVTLIMTLSKLSGLGAVIKEMNPTLTRINANLADTNVKTTAINGRVAQVKKAVGIALIAIPILAAVYTAYEDDEDSGVTGLKHAAAKVMNDRKAERKLVSKIKKAIK